MKINVHGGHSLKCRGAKSYLDEVNEDRKIKNEVISLLKEQGHTVYDCTDDVGTTQSANLKNIVTKCNAHSVDLDVSIHLNACTKDTGDGKNKGTETYIYSSTSKAKDYATRVQAKMKVLGFTDRGVKIGSSLYVLKHTNSPAMLIEVCFVDDKDDYNLYNKVGYKAIAKAIVEGILNKTITTATTVSATSTSTSSTSVDKTSGKAVTYLIKVANVSVGDVLNIRAKPNASAAKTGTLKYNDPNKYTIVRESNGWGLLKSGVGWINLTYTKKV